MSNLYSLKLLPLGEFPSQDMQKSKIKVRCFVIPVHVNPLHSGAIVVYSGATLVSFHFIAVSFRLVPVYSGTILVHSVSFRRHSAPFRHIPVYSVPFLCLVTPLCGSTSRQGPTCRNRKQFSKHYQSIRLFIYVRVNSSRPSRINSRTDCTGFSVSLPEISQ